MAKYVYKIQLTARVYGNVPYRSYTVNAEEHLFNSRRDAIDRMKQIAEKKITKHGYNKWSEREASVVIIKDNYSANQHKQREYKIVAIKLL